MPLATTTLCFENECCRLELDPEINCLILNWKGLVPSGPFREVHQQVLLLLRRYKFSKILSNARNMKTIGSADIRWLETHWVPNAWQSGLRLGAVVESDNVFNQMTVNSWLEKTNPDQIRFQKFKNLELARHWLRQH